MAIEMSESVSRAKFFLISEGIDILPFESILAFLKTRLLEAILSLNKSAMN